MLLVKEEERLLQKYGDPRVWAGIGIPVVILLLFLLLSSCTSALVNTQLQCLPMPTYSPQELARQQLELHALLGNKNFSSLPRAFQDYSTLRRVNQDCLDGYPPGEG